MHDIKTIRENPEAFDAAMARRGLQPQASLILALDEQKRNAQTELQELQAKRNQLAKAVGEAKRKGEPAIAEMQAAKENNERMAALESQTSEGGELEVMLASLPNAPAADVPDGADETGNQQIRIHGSPPSIPPACGGDVRGGAKEHFDLGEALGMMDFETAANMSGSRFVLLSGGLARLERALASFMLDIHTQEFGYTEVVPPLLVRDNALYGTGQLPKFEEDLFKTTTDHFLIPTAEVPLTNIVADKIVDEDYLPRRFTAYTPCFRSEAGSAGRDTRGMIRQHQFSKVELVSITLPEHSEAEHERLTGCAEEILKRLGLHFRTMLLCTGDMGFGAIKTYDLEVWLPGQNAFREISSCSNCGDFQARRMKARFKRKGEKKTEFLHTLNGSGLAIGRTMVAIMENYQQPDGSIRVPDALVSYMGGLEVIK